MALFLKKYINAHISYVKSFYCKLLVKTDKNVFSILFNLKSLIYRSKLYVKWDGDNFIAYDHNFPKITYKFRHQRQGNMAYEYGFKKRANDLANDYFLKRIDFKKGDIFFDCGANVGDIKLWFDLNGFDIEYVGFEPSPIEYECLKENIYPSKAYKLGLWNKQGELNFYLSSQNADSSLIKPKKFDKVISSKVKRLDELIQGKIKCLKLEAEGAEPEILEGIGNKLDLIEFITADLGFERGIEAESTLVPAVNYLLSRGFELVEISHGRVCGLFRNTSIKNISYGD